MKKLPFLSTVFMVILFASCSGDSDKVNVELPNEIKHYASIESDDYIYNDIEELVNSADFVLKAKALEIKSPILLDGYTIEDLEKEEYDRYGAPLTSIFTPCEFEVVEIYCGELFKRQEITLYMPYGEINGYALYSDSFPKFQVGCEYVLLLNKAKLMIEKGAYSEEYILMSPLQGWLPTQINLESQREIHESKVPDNDMVLNMNIFNILFEDCDSIEDVVSKIKYHAARRR
jgi:hypothetical protein